MAFNTVGTAFTAAGASPARRIGKPGSETESSNCRMNRSELNSAFGPLSQTMLRASRPRIALHVLVATTATPPENPEYTGTTCLTPATFNACAASYDASLPPRYG